MNVSGFDLGRRLADALGIEKQNVTRIVIDCEVDAFATVVVHSMISEAGGNELVPIVSEYRLEAVMPEQK